MKMLTLVLSICFLQSFAFAQEPAAPAAPAAAAASADAPKTAKAAKKMCNPISVMSNSIAL